MKYYETKKTKKYHLKGNTISPIYIFKNIVRRISSCFFKKHIDLLLRASMTVEAALVLPLFMFACINLNSLMEIYELSIEKSMDLYEELRMSTAAAAVFDYGDDITMQVLYGDKNFKLATKYTAKPWNGYSPKNSEDDNTGKTKELVYITPNGEAYHRSAVCPYLKLSIKACGLNDVNDIRNLSGGKYYKCDKCGLQDNGRAGLVFVTDYGELYHNSLECSYLKRTILCVDKSEAKGRHACPKCSE